MKVDWLLLAVSLGLLTCFGTLMTFEHAACGDSLALKVDSKDAGTLFCFLNPDCGCSRSTLMNLSAANLPHDLRVELVVEGANEEMARDYIHTTAPLLAGNLAIVTDSGHAPATTFGAKTSGLVIWVTKDKEIGFRGGITAARGESGPCVSLTALENAVTRGAACGQTFPVYGCQL